VLTRHKKSKSSGLFLSEMHSSTTMIVELVGFDVLPHPTACTVCDHFSTSTSTCCCVNANSESVSSRPKTPQPAAVYRFTTAVRSYDNPRPERLTDLGRIRSRRHTELFRAVSLCVVTDRRLLSEIVRCAFTSSVWVGNFRNFDRRRPPSIRNTSPS
jgi:hypothetical protein